MTSEPASGEATSPGERTDLGGEPAGGPPPGRGRFGRLLRRLVMLSGIVALFLTIVAGAFISITNARGRWAAADALERAEEKGLPSSWSALQDPESAQQERGGARRWMRAALAVMGDVQRDDLGVAYCRVTLKISGGVRVGKEADPFSVRTTDQHRSTQMVLGWMRDRGLFLGAPGQSS